MTQDQWVRFTGQNPSAYPPGKEVGGVVITAMHPVEQMRKDEALEVLRLLGLTLSTEVQWEYAARGGTGTVFWTGDVWEWCLDLFGPYTLPTEPGTGRRRTPDDAPPIFRGGGFRANPAHARSADRYSLYGTDYRAYDVGVRPARLVER